MPTAEMNTDGAPRLLVVGCGALANALLPSIVQFRWGGITLMDGDRVQEHNLERQPLYAPGDVGRPKCKVLKDWLRGVSAEVRISAMDEFFDAANAGKTVPLHDLVADCTDDIQVKRMLDRACADYGVALVSGSVHGPQAHVLVLHAAGEGEEIGREDVLGAGDGTGGEAMPYVPLATIGETGQLMAERLLGLARGGSPRNGWTDLFDGRRWTELAPPRH